MSQLRLLAALVGGAVVITAAEPARELFGPANGFRASTLPRVGVEVGVKEGRLRLDGPPRDAGGERRAVGFPLPAGERDLSAHRYVECEVANVGRSPVTFSFWALSEQGWGGVSTFSTTQTASGREVLPPGAREVFRVDLHAKYSGRAVYTKAIDPASVRRLELVFENDRLPVGVELGPLRVTGRGPAEPHDTSRRIRVPDVADGPPAPGQRVRHALPGWEHTAVRHVLTLPRDWQPGKRWPVIVEYTGNVFYHKFCYSTGRTEQGNLAYGLSRGEGFILLNLPFISDDGRREQVDGWGDIAKGIDYCLAALRHVQADYGADPRAIFYTGFSRGFYAANYLALRDDRIAAVWAGFLTLRHPGAPRAAVDGDGWRGVGLGWNERAARLGDRPWFHQPDELGTEVHADVEFLEDRPSTLATREWLQAQVARRTR